MADGRGRCGCCGKDCKLTVDGKIWHHHPEDPACYASADSKRCKGAGELPEGARPAPVAGDIRFLCRVPSGPTGCGHQVQLTANHRARSHQTPHGVSCAEGGSAWPIAVGPDGFRQDTAEWTEEDWARALGQPVRGGEILPAAAPEDLRIEPDRDFDPRPEDPHRAEADAAIAEAERIQREQDADYEQALRDGLEESRRRVQDVDLPHDRGGAEGCDHDWGGADAWDEQQGQEVSVTACTKCGLIAPDDPAVFDQTHTVTTDLGPETHPGAASDCRLPGCCTHLHGFEYMDDDNGHSGSFCPLCGTEEPGPCPPHELESAVIDGRPAARCRKCKAPWSVAEAENANAWRCPPDLLARMPEEIQRTAALNPECWDCGHEVTPLVDWFGNDGRPEVIVWGCSGDCTHSRGTCRPQLIAQDRLGHLAEGVFFVRHTARPPLDRLVYRVQAIAEEIVQATVVTAGPYAGRTGALTDPSEEITCTDLNGTPRPRRDRGTSDTSPSSPGPSGRSVTDRPTERPSTPSHPAPTAQPTPAPTTAPRSRPSSTPSAPSPSAPAAGSSTPGTTSGPTATAAGSTPSARKRTDVADAFSTPKQAVSESDKYDRYGRYKLANPDTGKPVAWTRATTFAKSIQDTFALSQWAQRMTLKGAALRPDIVAAVSTLDVKQDRERVNALVEDAKKAAGNKVAANLGTAVHSFTEDRDKALVGQPVTSKAIPDDLRPTVDAYELLLREFGLEPVPGLIEFTTAVKQYEICGTSDRCYKVTRDITFKLNKRTITLYAGEYVIGDVKTGADLSYGWMEICIQLAIYAQGLNTSGVWDWNTRTWGKPTLPDNPDVLLKVRTDVALVPHLPVDRKEGADLATLFAIDLDAGWAAAVLCEQVRSTRKKGNLATALTVADVADSNGVSDNQFADQVTRAENPAVHVRTAVASRPVTLEDQARIVTTQEAASAVWKEAVAARTPKAEVDRLVQIMRDRLESLVEKGA